MDVLYIPFKGSVDILKLAQIWRGNRSYKNIIIYQHGSDMPDAICHSSPLQVYVLAHGIDDPSQTVVQANHDDGKTTTLTMEALADRFNHDLAYVHSKIDKIKLYFCNNVGHQAEFAEEFQQHLVLFDERQIDVYQGNLYPATDSNAPKQASSDCDSYPVRQKRESLFFSPEHRRAPAGYKQHTKDITPHTAEDELQSLLNGMRELNI